MRGIAVCALVALAGTAHAGNVKKDVEKAVRAHVAAVLGYDDPKYDEYAAGAKLTTSVAEDGVLDGAGLRASLGKWILNFGYVQKTKIGNLKVSVAPGDAEAWASYTIHVTMVEDEMGDAPASFDLRATELYASDGAAWKITAGHWSRPVLDKAAKTDAAKGALGTLAKLADADDDGAGFIDQLRAGPVADLVSTRADVAVYGTDAKKPRLGGKKTQKAWKAWWKQVTIEGAVVSGLDDGGVCGWAVANLAIHKGDVSIPARAFFVLAMEAGVPKIVGAQLSVPTALPYNPQTGH